MDEDETIEALLALSGFSIFFVFASLGTILASLNPDSILYIEFSPKEDLFIISGFLLINLIFLFIFLAKSLRFKQSTNLNRRQVELYLISDKMIYYTVLCTPIIIFLFYFYFKYFETGIAIYLFLHIIFELGLFSLVIYNAFRIKRDHKEGLLE